MLYMLYTLQMVVDSRNGAALFSSTQPCNLLHAGQHVNRNSNDASAPQLKVESGAHAHCMVQPNIYLDFSSRYAVPHVAESLNAGMVACTALHCTLPNSKAWMSLAWLPFMQVYML